LLLDPLIKEIRQSIIDHGDIGIQLPGQAFQDNTVAQGDENVAVEFHVVVLSSADHLLSHFTRVHVLLLDVLDLQETGFDVFFEFYQVLLNCWVAFYFC
jgi:hypothetical protein